MAESKLIALTQGQVAIVDASDYDWLSRHKWTASKMGYQGKWYAVRSFKRPDGTWSKVSMHVTIMGGNGFDHRNNDGLDNRRDNLRKATRSQNLCNYGKQRNNTSGFKGVHWMKSKSRWYASLNVNKVRHFLGYFSDKVEAAKAYDEAAKIRHGEFACTNF